MSDQNLLVDALRDRFADAEQPSQAAPEPSVIKREGAPTLVKDAQGNWQTMEPPHPELDPVTPRLSHETQEKIKQEAEQRQQERVEVAKRLAKRIESDHYKALCDGQQAPVNSTGRPAVTFLADLKTVFAPPTNQCLAEYPEFLQMSTEERAVFLKASPEYVDWKSTWGLRELLLRGWEASKSARPGRDFAPISDDEILQEVHKVVTPKEPNIRNNRYVHD
jgi:hypothetical protein